MTAESRSRAAFVRAVVNFLKWTAISVVLFAVANLAGLVRFKYLRYAGTDPLRQPLAVVAVESSRLTLEDGRILVMGSPAPQLDWLNADWAGIVRRCSDGVEVGSDGSGQLALYGHPYRLSGCTALSGLLEIPLIPVDVYTRPRVLLGHGDPTPSPVGDPSLPR